MLLIIEAINKQLPTILDAIENSLLNSNETFSKIETAIGQISNPCYLSTCGKILKKFYDKANSFLVDKSTQAPPLTSQNPETQATGEAGTTPSEAPFTGSTPSPGPTEAAGSTTTDVTSSGGSTDGGSAGTATTAVGNEATSTTAEDATTSATPATP